MNAPHTPDHMEKCSKGHPNEMIGMPTLKSRQLSRAPLKDSRQGQQPHTFHIKTPSTWFTHTTNCKVQSIQHVVTKKQPYQNPILFPTVHGTSAPGIALSIANFDLHPEQCPGISTAGSRRFRSDTVLWICAASLVAKWNPPTTQWRGMSGARLMACFEALTTPAWLQPVKTMRPLSGLC